MVLQYKEQQTCLLGPQVSPPPNNFHEKKKEKKKLNI